MRRSVLHSMGFLLLLLLSLCPSQAAEPKMVALLPPVFLSPRCHAQTVQLLQNRLRQELLAAKLRLIYPKDIEEKLFQKNFDLNRVLPPSEYKIILEELNVGILILPQITECDLFPRETMIPATQETAPTVGRLSGCFRIIGSSGKMIAAIPFKHHIEKDDSPFVPEADVARERKRIIDTLVEKESPKLLKTIQKF